MHISIISIAWHAPTGDINSECHPSNVKFNGQETTLQGSPNIDFRRNALLLIGSSLSMMHIRINSMTELQRNY